jgi:hypothetical protein
VAYGAISLKHSRAGHDLFVGDRRRIDALCIFGQHTVEEETPSTSKGAALNLLASGENLRRLDEEKDGGRIDKTPDQPRASDPITVCDRSHIRRMRPTLICPCVPALFPPSRRH